jgi:hypothetical protein
MERLYQLLRQDADMPELTPYVVNDRWIVYALSTMEATVKYRREYDPNSWPIVRQAYLEDLEQLQPLPQLEYRRAA